MDLEELHQRIQDMNMYDVVSKAENHVFSAALLREYDAFLSECCCVLMCASNVLERRKLQEMRVSAFQQQHPEWYSGIMRALIDSVNKYTFPLERLTSSASAPSERD